MPNYQVDYTYTEKEFTIINAPTEAEVEYQFDNEMRDLDLQDVKILSIEEVID